MQSAVIEETTAMLSEYDAAVMREDKRPRRIPKSLRITESVMNGYIEGRLYDVAAVDSWNPRRGRTVVILSTEEFNLASLNKVVFGVD